MILLIPIMYIILVSLTYAYYLFNYLGRPKLESLLISSVNIPIFVSLLNYAVIHFFPYQKHYIYGIFFGIFIVPLLINIRNIFRYFISTVNIIKKRLYFKPDILNKGLLFLSGSVLLLTFSRMWLWPINWDDQIYYIEQAYSIGQDHSTNRFLDWGYFKNDQLRYQINPSIRPGLPFLVSISGLFSDDLSSTVLFSRMITFYFFTTLLFLIIYISKHNWPTAIFFTLTCYLFINLSIFGFKELVLISQTLICLIILSRIPEFRLKHLILFGALFGLMGFINYSGSFIAFLIFVIYLIFQKNKLRFKIFSAPLVLFLLIFFSGFELIYFIGIITDGGFRKIDVKQQTISVVNLISDKISNINSPPVILDNSGVSQNSTGNNELLSYDINNKIQLYTKGKLQGFFQYQYFGFIFVFFLLSLLLQFRSLIANRLTRYITLFLTLFYIFYIDLFNINRHQFSVVLSISHKYTAMLVPFVSIITSKSMYFWQTFFQKITLKYLYALTLVLTIFSIIFSKGIIDVYTLIIQKLIPLHQPLSYYSAIIYSVHKLSTVAGIFFIIAISILYIIFKNQLVSFWTKNYLSSFVFLIIIFYFPFLLFFHTNFGLDNTLLYSFSHKPIKLSKVKGWESLYDTVNLINTLPPSSRFLFVNRNIYQLGIHFDFPATNIYTINRTLEFKESEKDIYKNIILNNINYLLVNPKSYSFPQYKLIHKTADFAVYQIPPTD